MGLVDIHKIVYICLRKGLLGIKIKCRMYVVNIHKIWYVRKSRQVGRMDIHKISCVCRKQVVLVDMQKIVYICLRKKGSFSNQNKMCHVSR